MVLWFFPASSSPADAVADAGLDPCTGSLRHHSSSTDTPHNHGHHYRSSSRPPSPVLAVLFVCAVAYDGLVGNLLALRLNEVGERCGLGGSLIAFAAG